MGNKVVLRPDFCFLLAAAVLLLPLPWLISWFIATIFHEVCHWLALRGLKVKIYGVRLTASGALMDTETMTPWKEAVCAATGPIGGLLLVLTAKWWPELAVCGFVQSVFNLLPIYPLDGGRVLHGILLTFLPEGKCRCVMRAIHLLTACCLCYFAIYLALVLKISLFCV